MELLLDFHCKNKWEAVKPKKIVLKHTQHFFLCFAEGPLPSVLQEVSLPIITNNECEGMYRKAGYIEHIPNIFICAGYSSGGKDSCEVISLLNRNVNGKFFRYF